MIPMTTSFWCRVRRDRRILAAFTTLVALACVLAMPGCGGGDAASNGEASSATSDVKESDVEVALDAAHQYFMTGDLAKARAILARLVESSPEDPRPHELFGQVLIAEARAALRDGDEAAASEWRAQAADHYDAAVKGTPGEPGLWHSAGMVFYEAGRVEEALDAYLTATELDPLNPQYPLFAAQLLINADDLDQAESLLDQVLTLDPDLAIAHASKAIIETNRDNHDAALAHISEARELEPRRLDFRVQEARIHRLRGEPRRSAELLAPLSERDRAQLLCAEELALAYEEMDEHTLAENAWLLAYHATPNQSSNWLAAEGIARVRLKRGDREDALFWVGQARLLAPTEFQDRISELEQQVRAAGN